MGKARDADEQWIDAEIVGGSITVIEDDSDLPADVRLRWTGKAEDVGSMFMIPDPKRRCLGRAYVRAADGSRIVDGDDRILTRRCLNWKMRGLSVCATHGKVRDSGRAVAHQRLAEAADLAVGYLLRMATSKKASPSVRLRAINSILDRAGVRGGIDVSVSAPEWQEALKSMFGSK